MKRPSNWRRAGGDEVRARRPRTRALRRKARPRPHTRLRQGQDRPIEGIQGAFKNPESLAYGGSGLPELPLYKVGFRQMDLWEGYAGLADDALYIDLYEHWLEPAQKEAR